MKMKKLFYAFASAALAGVLALSSCAKTEPGGGDQPTPEPEPQPQPTEFAITPASVELTVMESMEDTAHVVLLEAVNADGAVVWAIDQPADSVLIGEVNPENDKQFAIGGIKSGSATVIATCGDKTAKCLVNVYDVIIDLPELETPADNQVTICVLVPDGTVDCGGVGCTGAGADEFTKEGRTEWNPGACVPFTPVDEILETVEYGDWENWWAVTLTSSDFSTLQTKVIGLAADPAATGWGNQWGKNEGDVVIIDGPGDLGKGIEPQLQNLEGGSIVYIAIQGWQQAPCVQKNEAGEAFFTLTALNLPEEAEYITICGNWDADSEYSAWSPGSGPDFFPNEDNTVWTATANVPANFEYKYVWSADSITWSWDQAQADGNNIPMDVTLEADDTVDAWIGGTQPEPAPAL